MKRKTVLSMALISGILFSGALTSCRKEADTLAKITIVDVNGNRFQNAKIRIYGDPTIPPPSAIIIDRTLYSDSDGEAIFDFTDDFKLGQAGFTVLSIEISSGDTLFNEGIIKIEEEKLNEETLVIQPI